jgi:hypothetical protein
MENKIIGFTNQNGKVCALVSTVKGIVVEETKSTATDYI